MPYSLGVDLGTTYTAAAIRRGDRLEIADLGTRTASIPSVVYLREDGTVLTGEAATRRGVTDPSRLAREFKRRMGDTTAILLGGVPYSVDGLMARMLQAVVATVTERQGEAPEAIAIAHPANWGQYKKDLLVQAVQRADLYNATMITEPEAAAVHYATIARLEAGSVVAVYDLGGGTFDAAVLRKTADSFELIGNPEGIERLGGIDFDEAVFRHVVTSLRGAVADLDPDDPVAQAAVSRLREECVSAKEALSSDTEVSIPVLLPNSQTEVRLTRSEFEAMIRPALADTLVVLNRSLRSAGVAPDQLHSVLLVGGSSRIPLIAQMVGAELGRPIALDIHPKHSVALGAAALAGGALPRAVPAATSPVAPITPPSLPVTPPAAAAPFAVAVFGATSAFPNVPDLSPAAAAPPSLPSTVPLQASAPPSAAPPASPPASPPQTPPPAPPMPPAGSASGPAVTEPPPSIKLGASPLYQEVTKERKKTGLFIGIGVAAALALGVGGALAFGGGGSDGSTASPATDLGSVDSTPDATDPPETAATTATAAPTTVPSTVAATTPPVTPTTLPDPCALVPGDTPCIRIDKLAVVDQSTVRVTWEAVNFVPDNGSGFHAHLYWGVFNAAQASSDAPAGQEVPWEISDKPVHTGENVLLMANRPEGAVSVCATVGLAPKHNVPRPDIFTCLDLPQPGG